MKANFITIEQFRAARALLGWSRAELAKRSGLSEPTVKRVEIEEGPNVSDDARQKLRSTLEAAGVTFTNDGAPGVKLKKKAK